MLQQVPVFEHAFSNVELNSSAKTTGFNAVWGQRLSTDIISVHRDGRQGKGEALMLQETRGSATSISLVVAEIKCHREMWET